MDQKSECSLIDAWINILFIFLAVCGCCAENKFLMVCLLMRFFLKSVIGLWVKVNCWVIVQTNRT